MSALVLSYLRATVRCTYTSTTIVNTNRFRRSDRLAQVRYDDGDEVKYLLPDEAKELRESLCTAHTLHLRHPATRPPPQPRDDSL